MSSWEFASSGAGAGLGLASTFGAGVAGWGAALAAGFGAGAGFGASAFAAGASGVLPARASGFTSEGMEGASSNMASMASCLVSGPPMAGPFSSRSRRRFSSAETSIDSASSTPCVLASRPTRSSICLSTPTTLETRCPVMSWNEHASKIFMTSSST